MSGNFIQTDEDLRERDQWLQMNSQAVAPYLHDGQECVVFTFSRREPAERLTTRIGGLPHWRCDQPWPVCQACSLVHPQPIVFIAQLNFRDSHLRRAVPGDVLTFHYCVSCDPTSADEVGLTESDAFRRRHNLALPALDENFVYVPGGGLLTWHSVTPEVPLVTAEDIPQVSGAPQIGPFYGTAHQAIDYPTPPEAYGGGIAGEEYTYLHFTLQGTKVGGYPPPIQPLNVPVDSRGNPMQFLGTIGSITADAVDEHSNEIVELQGDWMWGDMGCLYLWMSEQMAASEMTWWWECF